MNTIRKLSAFATIVALTLGVAAGSATAASGAATQHDHDHDHGGAATLTLDNGSKWKIDAPLSRAMMNIRGAMHANLPYIHGEKPLDRKDLEEKYVTLARTVNDEVTYMINNCKLEPEADAQLHLIIAQLLNGAMAMEGHDEHGSHQEGAVTVIVALDNYARYFDDPAFEPIRH